jgi:2-keto-4-pentenoate hydratase/2-oxohepta-3-ene-1,7-dioic acid hydratase in catechol pathway
MRRDALLIAASIVAAALVPSGASAAEGTGRQAARYGCFQAGEATAYGLVEGDRIRQIEGDLFGARTPTNTTYALCDVTFLAPTRPSKILALAGNYRSHLDGQTAHKTPELFFKVPSCLIPGGAPIVIPPGTQIVHPEGEMVVVIGRRASKVPAEKAKEYVLGVTCGNDVSARDWQQGDVQWWRAKGSDTFGPCGPLVAVGVDYDDLLLTTRVNGEVRQQQRTKDLIHNVAAIVSFASMYVTLEPGDLIYTGTPGKTREIRPGDVVEVELEGVGTLRNPVKSGR